MFRVYLSKPVDARGSSLVSVMVYSAIAMTVGAFALNSLINRSKLANQPRAFSEKESVLGAVLAQAKSDLYSEYCAGRDDLTAKRGSFKKIFDEKQPKPFSSKANPRRYGKGRFQLDRMDTLYKKEDNKKENKKQNTNEEILASLFVAPESDPAVYIEKVKTSAKPDENYSIHIGVDLCRYAVSGRSPMLNADKSTEPGFKKSWDKACPKELIDKEVDYVAFLNTEDKAVFPDCPCQSKPTPVFTPASYPVIPGGVSDSEWIIDGKAVKARLVGDVQKQVQIHFNGLNPWRTSLSQTAPIEWPSNNPGIVKRVFIRWTFFTDGVSRYDADKDLFFMTDVNNGETRLIVSMADMLSELYLKHPAFVRTQGFVHNLDQSSTVRTSSDQINAVVYYMIAKRNAALESKPIRALASSVSQIAPPTSCWDIIANDRTVASGLYDITPPGATQPIKVYCDMTTDGGGWTLFVYYTVGGTSNLLTSFGANNQAGNVIASKPANTIARLRVEGSSPTPFLFDMKEASPSGAFSPSFDGIKHGVGGFPIMLDQQNANVVGSQMAFSTEIYGGQFYAMLAGGYGSVIAGFNYTTGSSGLWWPMRHDYPGYGYYNRNTMDICAHVYPNNIATGRIASKLQIFYREPKPLPTPTPTPVDPCVPASSPKPSPVPTISAQKPAFTASCTIVQGSGGASCPAGKKLFGGGCSRAMDGCYFGGTSTWASSGPQVGTGTAVALCCDKVGDFDLPSGRVISNLGPGTSKSLSCNSDEVLLGAGAYLTGGWSFNVASTNPQSVQLQAQRGPQNGFNVYGLCYKKPVNTQIRAVTGSGSASCPTGTQLLAGRWSGFPGAAGAAYPSGNAFYGPGSVTALCAE